eukprot:6486255-Amphidinium_carterae.1
MAGCKAVEVPWQVGASAADAHVDAVHQWGACPAQVPAGKGQCHGVLDQHFCPTGVGDSELLGVEHPYIDEAPFHQPCALAGGPCSRASRACEFAAVCAPAPRNGPKPGASWRAEQLTVGTTWRHVWGAGGGLVLQWMMQPC